VGPLTQPAHRRYPIRTEEDVGVVRRAVARMAAPLGGVRPGRAELVATELATNILRHATTAGGYVLSRPVGDGIELLAVDHGPGLRAVDMPPASRPAVHPYQDGLANDEAPARGKGAGLGVGLASVVRQASTVDWYSTPAGTVVLARVGAPEPTTAGWVRWGGVNVPYGDAGDSGDGWACTGDRSRAAAVLVDGLGHGSGAAAAAHAAIRLFPERPVTDLAGFVARAHEAMRSTRGGVLGVCTMDPERDRLTYAGVGNVTGRVFTGQRSQGLLGQDGTLGTELSPPRIRVDEHPWAPGATLVLTSDGIRSRWDPGSYPGLLAHDPAVVAAVLHRDHARGTDDATVVVVQDLRSADR
jgi:anti-sigma regulatory factor (Ser/Thr protein kinase)